MIVSIRKILEDAHMAETLMRNPRYMSAMAKELKILGFTQATRVVDGKRRRVWVSHDELQPADLVRAAVFAREE